MDRITGLQDLQDRVLGLAGRITIDRMAGLQDLQDRVLWLSWGLKLDRITGLQDLQDCYKSYPVHPENWPVLYNCAGFTGLLQELSCPS